MVSMMMIVPSNEISNQNNKAEVGAADAADGDSMIPVTNTTNNVPAPAAQINPLDLDQNQKKPKIMMMMKMKIKTTMRAKNKLKRYNNYHHHHNSSSWISITAIMMITTIIILGEMLSISQAEYCRATFNTSHFFECPKMFFDAPTKTWCCGANTKNPRCCEWSEREKETENAHSKHKWSFDNIVTFFMLKLIGSIIVSLVVYLIYIKVKLCCQAMCEDDDDDFGTTTYVRPPRLSTTTTRRAGMGNNAASNGSLGNGRTSAHFHQNRRHQPSAQTRLPSAQTPSVPSVEEDAPVDECSLMIDECGIMLENDNPPSYSEAIGTSTTVNFDGNAVSFSNTPTAATSYDPPISISSTATTISVGRASSFPSVVLENYGTPTDDDGMGGANSQQNSSRPITGQDGQDDQQPEQQQQQQQQHPTPPPSYNMEEEKEEEVQVVVGKTQPPYNPEYADDMV